MFYYAKLLLMRWFFICCRLYKIFFFLFKKKNFIDIFIYFLMEVQLVSLIGTLPVGGAGYAVATTGASHRSALAARARKSDGGYHPVYQEEGRVDCWALPWMHIRYDQHRRSLSYVDEVLNISTLYG